MARRRLALLLPMAAIVPVGVMFWQGLWRDPRLVPSPLVGKAVPVFRLPPVKGRTLGLSSADLTGEVSLVNVFASWCVACRAEHPVLMQLRAAGVGPIHGLNYKNKLDDAVKWLDTMGDPYTRTKADRDGRVAIDWGVYGVPETFVVDRYGRIPYKPTGPVNQSVLDRILLPLIARQRQVPGAPTS